MGVDSREHVAERAVSRRELRQVELRREAARRAEHHVRLARVDIPIGGSTVRPDEQIVEAISKDEALQAETINHLKEHPDATDTMASLDAEHAGSQQDIINAVLNDPNLSAAAVEYVKSSPELLDKVVKLVM